MSDPQDVIVVGGGHNGLVAATLLARAGRRVLLLESHEQVGGTVGTHEIHPGFRAPAAFAGLERFHPAIVEELGLERHGLRWLEPRGGTLLLDDDGGEALRLDPAGDLERHVARHSAGDVETLREFEETRRRLTRGLEPLLTAPLPSGAPRLRDRLSDLRVGAKVWRGLSRAGLGDAMRLLPMSVQDVVEERFESPALRAAIAGPSLHAGWLGPRSAGTFWNLLWHRPAWVPHLFAAPRFAAGGPGALADALAAAARQAGVEIRTGARVSRIRVEDGAVRAVVYGRSGVAQDDGIEVPARCVVSALDPRRTLLDLLAPGSLDPEAVAEIRALRGRGNVAIVRLALERTPRFTGIAGEESLAGRIQIGSTLDELERAYDASKYGEIPERPYLELTLPSIADPTLAPPGGAVLHAWVQFVPYATSAANPEAARREVERRVLARLEEHAPGLSSSVLHVDVALPIDLERRFGLTEGCLHHLEPALDQQLWLRPAAGWHRHATPIRGLYLCGPGTHPGGGVTGLPGRCAAVSLLKAQL